MKRNSILNITAICAVLLIAASYGCEPTQKAAALAFVPFSESAAAEAQRSGKPAVIYATADWCPSCREFSAGPLADAKIRGILKDFTMFKIDHTAKSEETLQSLESLEINALPTFIIYDKKGKESRRFEGSVSNVFLTASLRTAAH